MTDVSCTVAAAALIRLQSTRCLLAASTPPGLSHYEPTEHLTDSCQLILPVMLSKLETFNFIEATDPGEWRLNSGTGERRFHATIKFPEPFTTSPRVAVALTGVDASNTTNLRIWIAAQDIETHEFDRTLGTRRSCTASPACGSWSSRR